MTLAQELQYLRPARGHTATGTMYQINPIGETSV